MLRYFIEHNSEFGGICPEALLLFAGMHTLLADIYTALLFC
jgi:hypothetical protein